MTPAEARAVLGITHDAEPAQVQASYRQLAKLLHPDRFPGTSTERRTAEEHLKNVNHAYEVLKRHGHSPRRPAEGANPRSEDSIFEESRRRAAQERQEQARRRTTQRGQEQASRQTKPDPPKPGPTPPGGGTHEHATKRDRAQFDEASRSRATDRLANDGRRSSSSRRRVITSRILVTVIAVGAFYGFAFITDEDQPMARGTLIVDADPEASTPEACAVSSWAVGSLGPGLPLEILGSNEESVGQEKFHDEDYPENYYDDSRTECAFNFGVAIFPGGEQRLRVAYGDYWTDFYDRADLEDGILLEILQVRTKACWTCMFALQT